MAFHQLSLHDYQGHGVYSHDAYGNLPMPGLPSMPNLTALQTGVEEINGLAHVPLQQKQLARQVLQAMVFTPTEEPEIGGVSGEANFVIGNTGSPWVQGLVQQGLVVMIDRESIPTSVVDVMATDQPATVALFAGMPNRIGGSNWVIVDGPDAVIRAAEQVHAGQAPSAPPMLPELPPGIMPTAPPCGPGQQEVYGLCWPLPGGAAPQLPGGQVPPGGVFPEPGNPPGAPPGTPGAQPPQPPPPPPQQAPEEQKKLSTAAIVGVAGIGAVAVLALIAASSGRQAPTGAAMTPNRRKRPKGVSVRHYPNAFLG